MSTLLVYRPSPAETAIADGPVLARVRLDESVEHDAAGGVEHTRTLSLDVRLNRRDALFADADVDDVAGVAHPRVSDHQILPIPPDQSTRQTLAWCRRRFSEGRSFDPMSPRRNYAGAGATVHRVCEAVRACDDHVTVTGFEKVQRGLELRSHGPRRKLPVC